MQRLSCEDCIATNWINVERQEALCRELRASGACLVQVTSAAFGLCLGTALKIPYKEREVLEGHELDRG